MKKILLLIAALSLAACGGPLNVYKDGKHLGTFCVRDCDIKNGQMVCVDHNGRKFSVNPGVTAAYNDGWRLGSCSCHYHFPE